MNQQNAVHLEVETYWPGHAPVAMPESSEAWLLIVVVVWVAAVSALQYMRSKL